MSYITIFTVPDKTLCQKSQLEAIKQLKTRTFISTSATKNLWCRFMYFITSRANHLYVKCKLIESWSIFSVHFLGMSSSHHSTCRILEFLPCQRDSSDSQIIQLLISPSASWPSAPPTLFWDTIRVKTNESDPLWPSYHTLMCSHAHTLIIRAYLILHTSTHICLAAIQHVLHAVSDFGQNISKR